VELRHIRYFIRAAELLHFTHAAESFYISQPTLSIHIQQLEEELGLPLFNRIGRNVRLTEAGNVFLDQARKSVRELDIAMEEIADMKGLKSGTLRLTALLLFGQEILPTWLAKFNCSYPNIQIMLKTGPSEQLEEELLAGQVDLALSFVPPSSEDLAYEKLFTEQIFFVVGEQHPLAGLAEITLSELSTTPLAVVSNRTAARKVLDRVFAEQKLEPKIMIEIDDLQALLKIAGAGNVGTLLGRLAVRKYPNLRLIPIADASITLDFGVLWHKHVHLSPPARTFLEYVKRECHNEPIHQIVSEEQE
jgi:LysR family cyn operon transcriptional activator